MTVYCVYYKDELGSTVETLLMKRVKRHRNRELIQLMEKLTEAYFINNASLGEVIADDSNWNLMKTVASMIPIVGKDKDGFDIERIADDYDQLTKLFFTTTYDESIEDSDELYANGIKPSLISKLHDLNWEEAKKKGLIAARVKAEKNMEEMVKAETT